jgi:hypothetical protein
VAQLAPIVRECRVAQVYGNRADKNITIYIAAMAARKGGVK